MLEEFRSSTLAGASDTDNPVTAGGSGLPLLPLRDYPRPPGMWHKVAPRAAETSPECANHGGYAIRAMAQDQIQVMSALGFSRIQAI
jgi:haloacetate dehalogenase